MNSFGAGRGLLRHIGRFGSDARGVSAVEFAVALPILLMLMWSEYTLCDALSLRRKMTITSHTIGDLISRQANLTAAGLTTILNASSQVMLPYSTSGAVIVVAQLAVDAKGNATVSWSNAVNGAGPAAGAAFAIPSGVAQPSTKIIYADVSYDYTPFVGRTLFPKIPLRSTYYIYPRATASVGYSG